MQAQLWFWETLALRGRIDACDAGSFPCINYIVCVEIQAIQATERTIIQQTWLLMSLCRAEPCCAHPFAQYLRKKAQQRI